MKNTTLQCSTAQCSNILSKTLRYSRVEYSTEEYNAKVESTREEYCSVNVISHVVKIEYHSYLELKLEDIHCKNPASFICLLGAVAHT